MIPMWMFGPSNLSAGNAFILKPSERDPSVPLMLAELMRRSGLAKGHPPGGQWRQRSSVDAMLWTMTQYKVHRLSWARPRLQNYIYSRAPGVRNGKRATVLWRREKPHDHHAGRGSWIRPQTRWSARAMARRVNVVWRFPWLCLWENETADRLHRKTGSTRIEKLKVGPYTLRAMTWTTARL